MWAHVCARVCARAYFDAGGCELSLSGLASAAAVAAALHSRVAQRHSGAVEYGRTRGSTRYGDEASAWQRAARVGAVAGLGLQLALLGQLMNL
jgi:hypothetical protein